MATFIMTAKLTREALQGMMAKPEDRKGPLSALAEASGGTIKEIYFTTGDTDIMLIIEADGPDAAAVAAMVAGAAGAGEGMKTVQAWSTTEFAEIAKRAGAAAAKYRAPGK